MDGGATDRSGQQKKVNEGELGGGASTLQSLNSCFLISKLPACTQVLVHTIEKKGKHADTVLKGVGVGKNKP